MESLYIFKREIIKFLMKIIMSIVIKLKLYRIFWEVIAFLASEKGLAWLSKTNMEEWGRKDADKILKIITRYP